MKKASHNDVKFYDILRSIHRATRNRKVNNGITHSYMEMYLSGKVIPRHVFVNITVRSGKVRSMSAGRLHQVLVMKGIARQLKGNLKCEWLYENEHGQIHYAEDCEDNALKSDLTKGTLSYLASVVDRISRTSYMSTIIGKFPSAEHRDLFIQHIDEGECVVFIPPYVPSKKQFLSRSLQ